MEKQPKGTKIIKNCVLKDLCQQEPRKNKDGKSKIDANNDKCDCVEMMMN